MKQLRNREGFTLIELLIVVVIIGILAAIAIPKFSQTREKAYVSSMKADLRNAATQQEIYYSDNYAYGDETQIGATASDGVTLDVVPDGGLGWSATTTHSGTDQTCSTGHGSQGDGTIACTVPAVAP